jgi:hypothetical protein
MSVTMFTVQVTGLFRGRSHFDARSVDFPLGEMPDEISQQNGPGHERWKTTMILCCCKNAKWLSFFSQKILSTGSFKDTIYKTKNTI